jgi:hypothetical protein
MKPPRAKRSDQTARVTYSAKRKYVTVFEEWSTKPGEPASAQGKRVAELRMRHDRPDAGGEPVVVDPTLAVLPEPVFETPPGAAVILRSQPAEPGIDPPAQKRQAARSRREDRGLLLELEP